MTANYQAPPRGKVHCPNWSSIKLAIKMYLHVELIGQGHQSIEHLS